MIDGDRYAHGHDAKRAVAVRHQIYRLPDANGRAELHITSEDGLHYLFAFNRPQAWAAVRKLTEILSRMSDAGPGK